MQPDSPAILEVDQLVTSFSGTPALHGISFSLAPGETIGIVGESGSGKSVTSLSIMGLLPSGIGRIDSGHIFFRKRNNEIVDIGRLSEQEHTALRGSEMAMVFQEPMTSLNPVMTCGDQVGEVLQLHKKLSKLEARRQTLELFKQVQLPVPDQMLDRYPHQLSGGQKQRVMIAMAIACGPRLLIADEPTTALDVTVQRSILELLKELQKQHGMALIFITHDLGVVADLADKVLVMYRGKMIEQGSVAEVFNRPKEPYTQSLLACKPPMSVRWNRLPVVSDFLNGKANEPEVITSEERQRRHSDLYKGSVILEARGLSTWYGQNKKLFGKKTEPVRAVDDVSFSVYEGETLGLVGESGCGKTTLGRTLIHLASPSAGKVIYKGEDITNLSEKAFRRYRSEMQIIFQDPFSALNPSLTVGQAIGEPLLVHGLFPEAKKRRARVMDLLVRVGLEEEHYYRYPHQFSGEQRQRICIARALALQPRFIICDESVSALDVSVQAQVLNLLNDLKREFKFTYIFISHDMAVVKFMSDRMMVMRKGRIEELGDPDAIYANPASEYTRRLIDAIPGQHRINFQ